MRGPTVTSWGNPAEGMGDCFHFHCQAGGWNRIGCTVFMDGGSTLFDREAHSDWSLMTEPSVYTMRSWGLLFSSDSVLPTGHSRQSFPSFLAGASHRDAGISFGTFPTPCFCLSSVSCHTCSILQYWVLCLTYARLARPSLHPFVSFAALWIGCVCGGGGGGGLTALYALTCSTFCQVCIGGRSSKNLMLSIGVSFVVPSMTRIASFCTLSSFSRFVCAIIVMPSPLSMTLRSALWYSRRGALFNTFCSHNLQDWQTVIWRSRHVLHNYRL